MDEEQQKTGIIATFQRIPPPVWIFLATIILVIGGVVYLSFSQPGSKEGRRGKTTIGEEVPILGAQHITPGSPHTPYNSNPPTSGPHWPEPAKNGIYEAELADEQIIHSLEHGHIWIAYKVDATNEVKDGLRKIVQENDWKIVLEPRGQNDSLIALAAWGRILKLDSFNEEKVREFIKAYRDQGPEKTPN